MVRGGWVCSTTWLACARSGSECRGTFVDDPSRAVHEASVLVDRTLDEIRANVGSGHTSETMSTEDLRVSFQRYREFFQRLLSA